MLLSKQNRSLCFIWILLLSYTLLFYASNNPDSFSISLFVLSFSILFLSGLTFLVGAKLVLTDILKINLLLSFKITAGVLFILFLILMRHSIFFNPQLSYLSYWINFSWYTRWLLYLTLSLIFFSIGFLFFKENSKGIIYLFIALNLFNLAKIISHSLANQELYKPNEKQMKPSVLLEDKRNIFFILTDSLTNIEGMQLLGIKENNQNYLNQLTSRGFIHYPHFYTSLQPTQFALYTYFGLSVNLNGTNAYNADISSRLGTIILKEGKLSALLKGNGYKINLFHELGMFQNPKNKCFADRCYIASYVSSLKQQVSALIGFLLPSQISQILGLSNENIFYEPQEQIAAGRKVFSKGVIDEIKKLDMSKPNFTYIHAFTFPSHSFSDSKTVNHCNEAKEIAKYNIRIQETWSLLDAFINAIHSKDSKAIIIIAGDHGPYIYRRCSREGIYKHKEIIERQGAFLAINWGEGYRNQYDMKIKTSHNLFRYLLSFLAKAEDLLLDADEDNAYTQYFNGQIGLSIKNGKSIKPELI
ncbi:MAG: sulfatase-like hydrolase/transferase [Proteobacteria bacterium]|nr:sulfatase-like hydrolase/transferase [Pseudomonadota bacterium]